MNLLDIPKEILAKLLVLLSVRDLLTLELTCSFLRDVVATRQVWLLELQRLVNAGCAIPLPPYVNVDKLDYSEIRSLVVRALKQLKTLRSLDENGFSGTSLSKSTVFLESQCDASYRQGNWKNLYYRMVPSLKLLIVSDAHLLEIFDVGTGVRKWHFKTDYRGMAMKAHAFALEECSPTSFRLFIAGSHDAEKVLIFHLFHLEKLVEGDTFSLKVADAFHNTSVCPLDIPRLHIGDISLGGDFAVIDDLLGLVVWDWKKNKMTQVVFPLENEIYDLQIVRDHLFYVLKFMYCRPCQVDIIPLRQFDDAPAMAQLLYSDIKRTFFKPVALNHNIARMPRVILYDLRTFGMGDKIRVVAIHHNYLIDGNTMYFTNLFEIDLATIEEFQGKRCVDFPMAHGTAPIIDPSVPSGLFIPTLTGSLLTEDSGDSRDDWTFRLPRDTGLHAFYFREDGSLGRAKLPPFLDPCDVMLQFEANALVQVFTEESVRKRAEIYHLV